MKRMTLFVVIVTVFCSFLSAQDKQVERWDVYELSLPGPSAGNPFVGITFGAMFQNDERSFVVVFILNR